MRKEIIIVCTLTLTLIYFVIIYIVIILIKTGIWFDVILLNVICGDIDNVMIVIIVIIKIIFNIISTTISFCGRDVV